MQFITDFCVFSHQVTRIKIRISYEISGFGIVIACYSP